MTAVLKIKKRKDFLRVAKQGQKMVTSSVILQAAQSLSVETNAARIGFTTTKKLGKAHIRNRARRRLRAALYPLYAQLLPNLDYVLIGRYNTADCPFETLTKDLAWGIKKLNRLLQGTHHETPLPPAADSAD